MYTLIGIDADGNFVVQRTDDGRVTFIQDGYPVDRWTSLDVYTEDYGPITPCADTDY